MLFLKYKYELDNYFQLKQLIENKEGKERLQRNIDEFCQFFEPFEGRQNFTPSFNFFNFFDNIYPDKRILFDNIKRRDKKVLPEMLAYCLSEMLEIDAINDRVRNKIERYFLEIMRNGEYLNYYDIDHAMIERDEMNILKNGLYQSKHIPAWRGLIFGSFPKIDNFIDLALSAYKMRLNKAYDIMMSVKSKENANIDFQFRLYPHSKLININKYKELTREWNKKFTYPFDQKGALENEERTTNENLETFFSDTTLFARDESYNVVIVTSSYQIIKIAQDIQKALHLEKVVDLNYKINKIFIVGTESFDDLMKPNLHGDKFCSVLHKKMFLHEVFMHLLDHNNHYKI